MALILDIPIFAGIITLIQQALLIILILPTKH